MQYILNYHTSRQSAMINLQWKRLKISIYFPSTHVLNSSKLIAGLLMTAILNTILNKELMSNPLPFLVNQNCLNDIYFIKAKLSESLFMTYVR